MTLYNSQKWPAHATKYKTAQNIRENIGELELYNKFLDVT